MNNIEWRYKEPLSGNQDLESIVDYVGVQLPSDYVAFVRNHNGASPNPRCLTLPNGHNVVLNRLLRVEADAVDCIRASMDALRDEHRIVNLIPFADDPFGNLFCFEYAKREFKGVVFWDHESNSTIKICTTFTDLIGNLHEEEN